MKKSIYLACLILYFTSCEKVKNIDFIINPNEAVAEALTLSHFATDIDYIPLSNEIPFQHINSVKIVDSLLFVGTYPSGLLLYNSKGNLIRKIGRCGRGPGEYKYGNKFTIDRMRKRIYILDTKKAIKYDFSGKFISEFTTKNFGESPQEIHYEDNSLFFFNTIMYGYAKYDWVKTDTLGHITSSKLNSVQQFKTRVCVGTSMYDLYRNNLAYYNAYNDTVFNVSDNSARLLIAKGQFRMPKNETIEIAPFFHLQNLFETTHGWVMRYGYQNKSNIGYYQKSDHQLLRICSGRGYKNPMFGIKNDLDGGLPFVPKWKTIDSKYLISSISCTDLKNHLKSKKDKTHTSKLPQKEIILKELADKITEDDNSILVIAKLRDNI